MHLKVLLSRGANSFYQKLITDISSSRKKSFRVEVAAFLPYTQNENRCYDASSETLTKASKLDPTTSQTGKHFVVITSIFVPPTLLKGMEAEVGNQRHVDIPSSPTATRGGSSPISSRSL